MDIKKFALLDWVEQDLIILRSIKTADNAADGLTKPLTKQLFNRHTDTILGKRIPDYVKRSNKSIITRLHVHRNIIAAAPQLTPYVHGGVRDVPSNTYVCN
jgi:hypothetical protein